MRFAQFDGTESRMSATCQNSSRESDRNFGPTFLLRSVWRLYGRLIDICAALCNHPRSDERDDGEARQGDVLVLDLAKADEATRR